MSLTSFLKNQDVKEEFARQFPKPKFGLKGEILAPPLTHRYSLVGTAFDYLLRFYLERLNPDAVTRPWVAEHAANIVIEAAIRGAGLEVLIEFEPGKPGKISALDKVHGTPLPLPETDVTRKVKLLIDRAKVVYDTYLSSGEMTDELIESCLVLAQLDSIVRAGYIDENIGTVHDEDVADLRNLISIVNPEAFEAKRLCMLNPTFGEASGLIGGADADLLIDDALIDIKTTKNLRLTRNDFNQLIGYYILFKIGGVDNAPHPLTIERVGIYYSRHAVLYTIPIRTIVNDENLPPFIEWFRERISEGVFRK